MSCGFAIVSISVQLLSSISDSSSIERALDNSDIITMSFSDGLKIDFEHDLFYNSNADESDNEVDVEELSTPGPTPPPDVDLTPMWTEWPMVKHILERHDQRVEDIIRQLDLLHEPMPEYKYYHDEFFQAE